MPKMAAAAEGSDVAPEQVIEFAGALLDFVERAVGMRLDYEEETLPVVDHYLGLAQRPLTAELFALVTPAAGCYFGEVVRRKFGGRWVLDGADPVGWRLQLEPCFLYLYPVGMAAEALVERPDSLLRSDHAATSWETNRGWAISR